MDSGGRTDLSEVPRPKPEPPDDETLRYAREVMKIAPSVRIARAICWTVAWIAFLVAQVYIATH